MVALRNRARVIEVRPLSHAGELVDDSTEMGPQDVAERERWNRFVHAPHHHGDVRDEATNDPALRIVVVARRAGSDPT